MAATAPRAVAFLISLHQAQPLTPNTPWTRGPDEIERPLLKMYTPPLHPNALPHPTQKPTKEAAGTSASHASRRGRGQGDPRPAKRQKMGTRGVRDTGKGDSDEDSDGTEPMDEGGASTSRGGQDSLRTGPSLDAQVKPLEFFRDYCPRPGPAGMRSPLQNAQDRVKGNHPRREHVN